jgi:hypothetical protein
VNFGRIAGGDFPESSMETERSGLAEQSPGDESRCELEYEDEQLLLQSQFVDALSQHMLPYEEEYVGEEWPDELMAQQSEDEQLQPESLLQARDHPQEAAMGDYWVDSEWEKQQM